MHVQKEITQTGKPYEAARQHRIFAVGIDEYFFENGPVAALLKYPVVSENGLADAGAADAPIWEESRTGSNGGNPLPSPIFRGNAETQIEFKASLSRAQKYFVAGGEIKIEQEQGNAAGSMGQA